MRKYGGCQGQLMFVLFHCSNTVLHHYIYINQWRKKSKNIFRNWTGYLIVTWWRSELHTMFIGDV